MSAPAVEVRHEVTEVLLRYATGIDRRDWPLLRSCFTDDCHADYGDIGVWHGAGEITEFMVRAHEGAGHTLHRITNPVVSVAAGGVTARSYVDAVIMFAGGADGVRAVGFYDDELVETDEGWRIARRRFTQVFLQMSLTGGS